MKINEIFYSIQGEGSWAGLPNIFIRTTGCNLRCSFCDTKYAYENGIDMKIEKILSAIEKYPCKHVCLTGGEPLLQQKSVDLIYALLEKNYKICLETNGSIDIKRVSHKKSLMISLDIKCPSSDMYRRMRLDNISYISENDQLKFVIKNRDDYDYAKAIIKKYKPRCIVFFQPVWCTNPENLSTWILNDGLNVRLGLQLHKILFGDKKGT